MIVALGLLFRLYFNQHKIAYENDTETYKWRIWIEKPSQILIQSIQSARVGYAFILTIRWLYHVTHKSYEI